MTSRWYCVDCETGIDADAIDDHEDDGHTVKGTIQPDRLLRNDPWNMGLVGDGGSAEPIEGPASSGNHDGDEPDA